jgi:hypothetical protein
VAAACVRRADEPFSLSGTRPVWDRHTHKHQRPRIPPSLISIRHDCSNSMTKADLDACGSCAITASPPPSVANMHNISSFHQHLTNTNTNSLSSFEQTPKGATHRSLFSDQICTYAVDSGEAAHVRPGPSMKLHRRPALPDRNSAYPPDDHRYASAVV